MQRLLYLGVWLDVGILHMPVVHCVASCLSGVLCVQISVLGCYVMKCNVMLCHALLCNVMKCHTFAMYVCVKCSVLYTVCLNAICDSTCPKQFSLFWEIKVYLILSYHWQQEGTGRAMQHHYASADITDHTDLSTDITFFERLRRLM